MKSILKLSVILFFIFNLTSCNDLPVDNDVNNQPQIGMVIWSGHLAADGCGWMIRIGDTDYKPDSLPQSLQYDSAVVNIVFEKDTSQFICGFVSKSYPFIKVKTITKHSDFCAPLTFNYAPYKTFANDDVSILDAKIKKNCLYLKIQYSGGCKTHIFRLICNSPKCGTPPLPPLTLNFQHDSNKDACEALITKEISFDLTSLRNPDSTSVHFTLTAPAYQKKFKYSY